MSVAPRIVVAAGGTGGHVFPGLAIAAEVQKRGGEVAWLGVGGMETKLAKARGLAVETIPFQSPRGISGWVRLPGAVWRAVRFLRRLRPAAVLAMGGYPGVPGGLAAALCGIPLVIHEQNARPGKANIRLCKLARRIIVGFPDALPGGMHLGNPAREEFFQLPSPEERFADDLESPPRRLLILGGSQGAESLNTGAPEAASMLSPPPDIMHQCGRGNADIVRKRYADIGCKAEVFEFADDIAARMAAADVVVCRSGASTLAELAAAGAAAILVPYPHAANQHQTANALFYTKQKAAMMLETFSALRLAEMLRNLTRLQLLTLAKNMRALAKPEAAAAAAAMTMEAGGAA